MAKDKKVAETPLMKQYNTIKARYPDALLLFRVGDFYETFGQDAITASNILGIVLTKRANGAAAYIDLAGFPHHSLDTYLPKLVRAGQRVAICDQLEDPKLTKKIVKRGVTELVTPGVSYNDKVLEQKENNFLASVHLNGSASGVSFLDISTGEFFVAEGSTEYLDKLLQSLSPSEVIIQRNEKKRFVESFGDKYYIATFEDWVFTTDFADDILLKHFAVNSFKGFGIENLKNAIIAAGAAMHYLSETHHHQTSHISKISRIEEDKYVWLDRFTIRNLELINSTAEGGVSLLKVIDKTNSPMGGRMLKRWITMPLKEKHRIDERLDIVEYLTSNDGLSDNLSICLKNIGDIERLISKAAVGRINPREIVQVRKGLDVIEEIKGLLENSQNQSLRRVAEQLNFCPIIRDRLKKEIQDDPPMLLNKGNVIADGVSRELDELRSLAFSGKDYLVQIRDREIKNTGIPSLKISYNNVFGYYLEVTNTHKDKVPDTWHRKQTLTNSERYITEELKEYEQKILGAEEKIQVLEQKIFTGLVVALSEYVSQVLLNGQLIGRLDVLHSFAKISSTHNYNRPQLSDSYRIDIKNGRHPVIEQQLSHEEEYIANDVALDPENQQIIILTGPNMSGKSALLRQTALIVLMAQMGCFVPADSAEIGLVDKVFTRVGASDNISSGESTFMVEMNETASILNNVSERSLILLDEIGRGTSTYDGISIAWAITEYLHEHPQHKAKVLFATHYHELNDMSNTFKNIKNYHIAVKDTGNKVIFLRKIKEGGSEHSFGIHVAKMAGMPPQVLSRANEILAYLEDTHGNENINKSNTPTKTSTDDNYQLSFIQLDDPLLQQIKEDILNTDVNTLTPVEALMKLNEIKKLLSKK
ncbi:MAG: DNA mismatch repair protein MutS [Hyphomicrobiales bacterium]